jgi:hypothetical protein
LWKKAESRIAQAYAGVAESVAVPSYKTVSASPAHKIFTLPPTDSDVYFSIISQFHFSVTAPALPPTPLGHGPCCLCLFSKQPVLHQPSNQNSIYRRIPMPLKIYVAAKEGGKEPALNLQLTAESLERK